MGEVFDHEETSVITDSTVADFGIGQLVLYAKLLFVGTVKGFCGFFKIFCGNKGFPHTVEISSCINQYVDPKMEIGRDTYVYFWVPLLNSDLSDNRSFLWLD